MKALTAATAIATGLDAALVRRTANKLSEAGFLQSVNCAHAMPADAGYLLYGIGSGRSPGETVDCLLQHLRFRLTYVGLIRENGETPVPLEEFEAVKAAVGFGDVESVPDWISRLLEPPVEGVRSMSCQAAIERGPDAKAASIIFSVDYVEAEPCAFRLVFRDPDSKPQADGFTITASIGPAVFAALSSALNGDKSAYATEGAAVAATVN